MTKTSEKYDYNSTFPKRLRALMEGRKVTQQRLSEICSVKAQSVSQWRNGETRPDILSLSKIARFFNVSTDYLLGLTDIKSTSTATKELCATLGLSEEAVKILSADTSSVVATQWNDLLNSEPFEDFGHPNEMCQKIREGECLIFVDSISSEVSFVFNRLIEDLISANTKLIKSTRDTHENAERSLIDLLKRYYDCNSMDVFNLRTNGKSYSIPNFSFLEATSTSGDVMMIPMSIKELLINSFINDISARLNNNKYNILTSKEGEEESK